MAQSLAHRRKQIRLKEYDYSQPGAYFVTMCTKDRDHYLGEIVDGRMNENDLAAIAQSCWNELPEHYPNVQLDEFVIMPNHVHGIIILLDDMADATSRRPNSGAGRPRPYPKPALGQIIAYFKYQSAKRINATRCTPGTPFWQRGYYDHIIRDDKSLNRIRNYIATNPQQWWCDKENAQRKETDHLEPWLEVEGQKGIKTTRAMI